jgi:capsular polysaccharide biosynthesis protein
VLVAVVNVFVSRKLLAMLITSMFELVTKYKVEFLLPKHGYKVFHSVIIGIKHVVRHFDIAAF